jgi:hypothetical protein
MQSSIIHRPLASAREARPCRGVRVVPHFWGDTLLMIVKMMATIACGNATALSYYRAHEYCMRDVKWSNSILILPMRRGKRFTKKTVPRLRNRTFGRSSIGRKGTSGMVLLSSPHTHMNASGFCGPNVGNSVGKSRGIWQCPKSGSLGMGPLAAGAGLRR